MVMDDFGQIREGNPHKHWLLSMLTFSWRGFLGALAIDSCKTHVSIVT